ncbi:GATOR1 complex protein NPRL3-like isoform X2 [Artemia franciscana]|uniref:GATOR1 complex protein NPRL3-like isoform X2 n=1 Tax=Artemia franciscana TaxID=6661 RepID=UPI0032DBC4F1
MYLLAEFVVLSHICAVKSELCGKKFELKVNEVRFVGHPILLPTSERPTGCRPGRNVSGMLLFSIVFALRATANHSIVDCYHDLSKRIGIAILYEEKRCNYLTKQSKRMLSIQDEYHEDESKGSPFERMLSECQLSRELKTIFDCIRSEGRIHVRLNGWVLVSFCLPQKAYSLHYPHLSIKPSDLHQCIRNLMPYHTILLLIERDELLSRLPLDSSPALKRLIRVLNPTRSIQSLAADADVALDHVLELCGYLVYWAFGTPIFPLCDANAYVIAPFTPSSVSGRLAEKFSEEFPGCSFIKVLSEYALPVSIGEKRTPFQTQEEESEMLEMILWLLKQRILMQIHTYVALIIPQDHQTTRRKFDSLELRSDSRTPSESDRFSNDSDEVASSLTTSGISDNLLPSSLSSAERLAILKVPRASDPEDLKLFAKLLPYFHGTHPLEEIMFRENIRRSQVFQLLDKFRSVLVLFQHEDTATSMFYRNFNDHALF